MRAGWEGGLNLEGFSRTRGLEGFLDALFLDFEEALRMIVFGDRDQRGDRRGKRNLGMEVAGGIVGMMTELRNNLINLESS